jgi:hypothetical protein
MAVTTRVRLRLLNPTTIRGIAGSVRYSSRAPPFLRLGVVYDFRNPPDSGISTPRLYAEVFEQARA